MEIAQREISIFDPAAFEETFMENYTFLCSTAFQVVEDEEVAKDIVQDFFLYCWSKKIILQQVQHFKSYSYRAVRNASLNYRKKSRKYSFEEPEVLEKNTPLQFENEKDEHREATRHDSLWKVINQLPEQRRIIFLLSNRDELKYKEIAEKLNISINTVKTQIRLAYQFLRKEGAWLMRVFLLWFIINR